MSGPRRDLAARLWWMASRVQIYTDPLQHALIAAVVAAPLAPRAGRSVITSAVAAALVIDVDHVVAARSVRVRDTTALATRPRTHSLVTALAAGTAMARAVGPVHGWVVFGALASHLLHDAGDRAAPTPVLWPFKPARQFGRRVQIAGTAALVGVSFALAAASAPSSDGGSTGA
jgi:LexA-binding, inner membrane-associated putative hydrolase